MFAGERCESLQLLLPCAQALFLTFTLYDRDERFKDMMGPSKHLFAQSFVLHLGLAAAPFHENLIVGKRIISRRALCDSWSFPFLP